MKLIPLYRYPDRRPLNLGTPVLAGYAQVDDEEYEWLIGYSWVPSFGNKRGIELGYAVRNVTTPKGQRRKYMHHEVLPLKRGMQVSHIDGNRLNNQRSNLEYATQSKNRHNPNDRLQRNNATGIRGVSRRRRHGRADKYVAQIRLNGKIFRTKPVSTKKQAAEQLLELAKKLGVDRIIRDQPK